jgi:acetyl esterase/lipase
MKSFRSMAFASFALLLAAMQLTANAADPARTFKDVVYASAGGKSMALDLYLPASVARPPLIVYVHGGAWSSGNKTQYPAYLVERGFALASLDFRSTNEAPFPANVHDIKAGIRFLRAKAALYGYRADRIAIVGTSSGGHLAALVGLTAGVAELEGSEGDYPRESSAVQAIVSYFGASNLATILAQSTPDGLKLRAPALERLLGASPDKVPALTALASPVTHVDRNDPPAFLLHGDQDLQMPVNQLLELQAAYRKAGLSAETLIVNGAGHGSPQFSTGEPLEAVVGFLRRTLGP